MRQTTLEALRPKLLAAIALVAIALFAVACGSDPDAPALAPSPASPPAAQAAPTATPAPIPLTSTPEPTATQAPVETVKVGSNVGERIPDFEMTLDDGSKVSAVSLLESEQPTFLFFFTTS